MRKGLILVCVFFCLGSCTDSSKIPSSIIPKDKMEKVLWDMMLADRYSAQYLLRDSASRNVKVETMKLYEQVFQIHKISQAEFVKSFKYYLNRPDITKVIFLKVKKGAPLVQK